MRVLFVLQSIGYGGSMTSLINLLSLMRDNKSFEYEALFMDPYGELFGEAQKVATVCKRNIVLEASTMSRKNMLDRKLFLHLLIRCGLSFIGKLLRCTSTEIGFSQAAKRYDNCYDCVVAYQESVATNFSIRIKANRHIAWVHNDYDNVKKLYENEERLQEVYSLYDKVVCVSKAGADSFRKLSGVDSSKFTYIYNTIPVDTLRKKASILPANVLNQDNRNEILAALESPCIKLVSSGRFARQKRFDRVVEVAKLLKEKGYQFKWLILGTGELYDEIKSMIITHALECDVLLTGGLTNPFPVVKACDFFVLTSEFEAHPMVANEALILGLPVITTNFKSAQEVVCHGATGLICEMNVESIAESIQAILDNKRLRTILHSNVDRFTYSNEAIIQQVTATIVGNTKVEA